MLRGLMMRRELLVARVCGLVDSAPLIMVMGGVERAAAVAAQRLVLSLQQAQSL